MSTASTEVVAYDPALFPASLFDRDEGGAEQFAARFAHAKTIGDLFDALEGNTASKLVGRSFKIAAVRWQEYQSERGLIPNAICTAADLKTGEVLEFATTSDMLTVFLRYAELTKALPFDVKITSTKTRNGFNALNFERV